MKTNSNQLFVSHILLQITEGENLLQTECKNLEQSLRNLRDDEYEPLQGIYSISVKICFCYGIPYEHSSPCAISFFRESQRGKSIIWIRATAEYATRIRCPNGKVRCPFSSDSRMYNYLRGRRLGRALEERRQTWQETSKANGHDPVYDESRSRRRPTNSNQRRRNNR